MSWAWRACGVVYLACIVLSVFHGQWLPWIPIYAVGAAFYLVAGRRERARDLAKKDLREVYRPKRDRFHRDLERLNKLRDAGSSPAPREVVAKRECTGSYDCTCMVEPKKPWRDRRTVAGPTYGAILEYLLDVGFQLLVVAGALLSVVCVLGAIYLLINGTVSLL